MKALKKTCLWISAACALVLGAMFLFGACFLAVDAFSKGDWFGVLLIVVSLVFIVFWSAYCAIELNELRKADRARRESQGAP